MTAVWQQQRPTAAMASRRLSIFAAVLLVTSSLGHRYGLIEAIPFFWLLGLSGAIAAFGLACGAIALVQTWEHGIGGLSEAAVGLIVGCLVLTPFGISLARVFQYPRLVDVSTDVEVPPPFIIAAILRSAPMNPIGPIDDASASLQRARYPSLIGRRYEHPAESVSTVVLDLMTQRGWQPQRVIADPMAGERTLFEGAAKSFFLGFPADVVVRVVEEPTATFVDMRSASLYGRHDLGDNAVRIRRFLDELDKRMAQLSGS